MGLLDEFTAVLDSVEVGAESYVDEEVVPGTQYFYALKARDDSEQVSQFSNPACAMPGDATPPAMPAEFVTIPGNGEVALTWAEISDCDLSTYRILRSSESELYVVVDSVAAGVNSYSDSGLINFTEYCYQIQSVDNAGLVSDPTPEVCATPEGPAPDLALEMTVNESNPAWGAEIMYTLGVTNNGPNDDAVWVVVTDSLPTGLTYISHSADDGDYEPASKQWDLGDLLIDATATLTITARVDTTGLILNRATVDDLETSDSVPENNTASAEITAHACDLAVDMTLDTLSANVGDEVTFTVYLENLGPDLAEGVEVMDMAPGDLSFLQVTPSAGTFVAGRWRPGSLAVGAIDSLVIVARVDAPGDVTNTATASVSWPPDLDDGNDSIGLTVNGVLCDLELIKTADNLAPLVGDPVTMTLTVTNHGPSSAEGVVVTDVLPDGFSYTSIEPAESFSDSTWTVGSLGIGASAVLTIEAVVDSSGSISNYAYISHSDQADPDPNNNSSYITCSTDPADLALAKTVNDPSPAVGDTLDFTVTLSNGGPSVATNVSVLDQSPTGLDFIDYTAEKGDYDSGVGVWSVDSLEVGESVELHLAAVISQAATIVNTARIIGSEQRDDNVGNNNASVEVTGLEADLALTKTVDNAWPEIEDVVTFLIEVRNLGPSDAGEIVIVDPLPYGLNWESDLASIGSYDKDTGLWTLGALAADAVATLHIEASVFIGEMITNTAIIVGSDLPDPEDLNNDASVSLHPAFADLALVKTAAAPNVVLGELAIFDIAVTNNGPDDATGITVEDLLPEHLVYAGYTTDLGTYDSLTGIWNLGSLADEAVAHLELRALAMEEGEFTNSAQVVGLHQTDDDEGDNSDSADVLVADPPPAIIPGGPYTATPGEDLALTATIMDNTGVLNASLHYREGNDGDYETIDFPSTGGAAFEGTVPGAAIGIEGLYCYVSARDDAGHESLSDHFEVAVLIAAELEKPEAQPGGSEQSAYRMISVPMELDDPRPIDVLEDDLGPYNTENWRLFGLGGAQTWLEQPDGGNFEPGVGMFLIVRESGLVIDAGPGRTVPMHEPLEVNLHQGWTMIGNPFNVSIPQDQLSLASDGSQPVIWNYQGSWGQVVGDIVPWQGYLVESNLANDQLLIDPIAGGGDRSGEPAPTLDWAIQILARAEEARDECNYAAVSAEAQLGWDRLDWSTPPPIGGYVSVSFPHPEWERNSKQFNRDVRPRAEAAGGHVWDFELDSNLGIEATLSFAGIEDLPAEYAVWLIDRELLVSQNLRDRPSYRFVTGSEARDFGLIVGGEAFVADQLAGAGAVPSVVTLSANFPNPFNPLTTIRYSLPQDEVVDLAVFDVRGRLVKHLLDGEHQDPGYHAVIWDGSSEGDRRVASGIYFYRLRAGDMVISRKMVMLK
ncbi:MAG: DUF11 domain-containing protein [bacterium]|nr:DUF11 domain-containing protein [bacterium]